MFPLLSHLFRGCCSPHINYFPAGSPARRQSGALAAAEEAPLLALAEFAVSLVEKMQAQEILRSLRLPEFDDLSQFFRNLPTTALVGIGAFAAVVAYWFASRPKAVKPPCDLRMQSEEVEVRLGWHGGGWISLGVCKGGTSRQHFCALWVMEPRHDTQRSAGVSSLGSPASNWTRAGGVGLGQRCLHQGPQRVLGGAFIHFELSSLTL